MCGESFTELEYKLLNKGRCIMEEIVRVIIWYAVATMLLFTVTTIISILWQLREYLKLKNKVLKKKVGIL